ncbi:hypothetical protein LINGRAHAP2_LOCUS26147 [Linum grandiflorum]
MLRFCTKLRSLAAQSSSAAQSPIFRPSSRCLITVSSPPIPSKCRHLHSGAASTAWSLSGQLTNAAKLPSPLASSPSPFSLMSVRCVSSRERKKRRKPMTPVTSKVKKVKMKGYSSYKSRFRPLKDGTIRCWHEGKRHNAHLKSSKAKRRLRQPSLVHPAYATVMKKLGFFN